MAIAWPINLNVSWKLHSYSLQRTRSHPGTLFPKRIRKTHPHNYYNHNGKKIDVHLLELYSKFNCHSVVTRSISTEGDHRVNYWWHRILSKQMPVVPYVARKCLPDFLVMKTVYHTIPLLKKENVHLNWIIWNRTACIKMDLVSNSLQRFVTLCRWSAKQTITLFVFGAKLDKGFWTRDIGWLEVGKGTREESWTKELEEGSWRSVTRVASRHRSRETSRMRWGPEQWGKTSQDELGFQ